MITWTCEACSKVVRRGDGCVLLYYGELNQSEKAVKEWEASHTSRVISAAELVKYPSAAVWRILHFACSDQEKDGYAIDVERIASFEAMLNWTAHLMEKSWIGNTTWPDLIRGVVGHVGL